MNDTAYVGLVVKSKLTESKELISRGNGTEQKQNIKLKIIMGKHRNAMRKLPILKLCGKCDFESVCDRGFP